MQVHRSCRLSPALLLLCSAGPAWAQVEDTFVLNAGYSLQSDSNLFRLPASALIGTSSAAEKIGITSLGLSVNKAYSLQRFELNLNLIDYRYQNFSYLSYTANNSSAAWRWSLTPRLHGNFTTDRKKTLNSFADSQAYNVRNQRTNTNTRFDAVYELDGTWRVLGGVSRSAQTDAQPLAGERSYNATSADMGLLYAFASGSSLGYTLKNAKGTYLNRVLSSAGLYDDHFEQRDSEFRLHWLISGNSTADFSATHISRTHPQYPQRDYSGLNTAINLNWRVTGKSALTAGWTRELSSYQTGNTNYAQTDRFSFGPVWRVSPRTAVRLRHEIAVRDFPDSSTGLPTLRRSDTTRDTSLSLDWQPHRHLTVSASLQNARRTSNIAGLDYDSNMATVSAQLTY